MNVKRARQGLITLALLIGVVWLLWFTLEPIIPYVIVGLLLACIYQWIFSRRRL